MIYVGIDPGADGAVVALSDEDVVLRARLPTRDVRGKRRLDVRALAAILHDLGGAAVVRVVVEEPSVRPGEGAQGALGVGLMHGGIRAVLDTLGLAWRDVRPQVWRAGVGLPREPDRRQRKADSITAAERLLPDLDLLYQRSRKPHDGTAEAALIAVWARGERW